MNLHRQKGGEMSPPPHNESFRTHTQGKCDGKLLGRPEGLTCFWLLPIVELEVCGHRAVGGQHDHGHRSSSGLCAMTLTPPGHPWEHSCRFWKKLICFSPLNFHFRKIHGNKMTKCMGSLLLENFNRGILTVYTKLLKNHSDCTNIILYLLKRLWNH